MEQVKVLATTQKPLKKYSIVEIIERLIEEAGSKNASDIHLDPEENNISIKFRIDGILHERPSISKNYHSELIGRIKVLARLRTDEHYTAQDGRFNFKYKNQSIDIRVSILPSYYGENAVLRLLRKNIRTHTLHDLGFDDSDSARIESCLKKQNGMIIITGPTGSGKTTTLYTLIKKILSDRLIVTIEDPVEYAIPGARQIQAGMHKSLTFAQGLRSILRQDPDAIMVGEIRDAETAHVAVHAALTGHLLLSTMHTTDAATVLPRLLDMGIDAYLVAATVDIIIAQRLVRKICQDCAGKGCHQCDTSGFKGRIGIYEIIEVTDDVKSMIVSHASAQEIKKHLKDRNFKTMLDDGLEKAERGIVNQNEVRSTLT